MLLLQLLLYWYFYWLFLECWWQQALCVVQFLWRVSVSFFLHRVRSVILAYSSQVLRSIPPNCSVDIISLECFYCISYNSLMSEFNTDLTCPKWHFCWKVHSSLGRNHSLWDDRIPLKKNLLGVYFQGTWELNYYYLLLKMFHCAVSSTEVDVSFVDH